MAGSQTVGNLLGDWTTKNYAQDPYHLTKDTPGPSPQVPFPETETVPCYARQPSHVPMQPVYAIPSKREKEKQGSREHRSCNSLPFALPKPKTLHTSNYSSKTSLKASPTLPTSPSPTATLLGAPLLPLTAQYS